MPGPPDTIPASALWMQLQEMPRPSRVVDYPRADPITGDAIAQVVIQVVSQAEQMSAAAAADRYAIATLKRSPKKDEHSEGYETIYNNECTVQLLFRAVRRAEQPTLPLFPSADSIRELTQDEVGALARMYLIVQRELGPVVSTMTEEEKDAWLRVLGEGASAFPLACLDSAAIEALLMHSARRLLKFSTDSSSAGTSHEAST